MQGIGIMSDIEETAFQIARYMCDNNYTSYRTIQVDKIREALDLTPEDFDAADIYLRDMGFYDPISPEVTLTTPGIAFVSRKKAERIDIPRDAEQLAHYLSLKQSANKSLVVDTEIMTDLQWNEKRYWQAGQVLVDEGLAEVKPKADNIPFKGLSLNGEGRKAVRHNFRRQSAANVHVGDSISVESHGSNVAIAGRNSEVTQNIPFQESKLLFDEILRQLEKRQDLSLDKRQEIKDVIELAQDEAKQKEPNERRLTVYFRNLSLMAPDILEVAVVAASAAIIGPIPVALLIAKKVAEKIKEDAKKGEAG